MIIIFPLLLMPRVRNFSHIHLALSYIKISVNRLVKFMKGHINTAK